MKQITKLEYRKDSLSEAVKKPSYREKIGVYLDGEFAFSLYYSEIRQYGLKEDMYLSPERYGEIVEEVLWKRAKRKALNLLSRSDRTESELKERFLKDGFPEEITLRTIEWLKEYCYIDDRKYTHNYLENKKREKSIAQLKQQLYRKGISREIIEEEAQGFQDDSEAIQNAIRKKTNGIPPGTYQEKQKLAAYLYRKGFSGEEIRRHIQLYDTD